MGREAEKPLSKGARMLRAFVDENYPEGGVPRFCEVKKLDRIAVQRAMNGSTKRVSVGLAAKIEDATGGFVPMRAWILATVRTARAA